jgi:hypothetical protein
MTQAAKLAQLGSPGISTGFKNRIINGAMVIDQRNAGASVTISNSVNTYTLDRWSTFETTDGVITVQQVTDAPAGFTNSVRVTTTTADASLAADQRVQFQQPVEGYNCSDFGWGTADAKTVTLSFWVKSSLTGTFAGAFTNENVTRSYVFNYTISAANTWEQKSVTVPGDTSGTWLKTNGLGIRVYYALGTGSDFQNTANTWLSAFALSTAGAVSVVGTLSATWQLTGVQLEVGTTSTDFEYIDYGRQVQQCYRYYYRITAQNAFGRILNAGLANSSTLVRPSVPLPTPMRTSVSAVDFGGSMSCYDGTAVFSVSNVAIDVAGINTIGLNVTTSGTTGKQTYQVNDGGSGGSYIGFSAEL